MGKQAAEAFIRQNIGKVRPVLFEEYLPEEGCITGYTDNYLKVYVQTDPEGAENCLNSILPVRITDTFLDAAVGVLL